MAQSMKDELSTSVRSDGNLEFIENKNQWNKKVLYKTDIGSHTIFLEKDGFTFNLINLENISHSHAHNDYDKVIKPKNIRVNGHVYKVHFLNSNLSTQLVPSVQSPDYINYFIGKNKSRWVSYVRKFKLIEYQEMYKNINLKVYSTDKILKYDFIISPNGNTDDISFSYEGIDDISINSERLVIKTSVGKIYETKPIAYQMIGEQKIMIPCKYFLQGQTVRFIFPEGYDKTKKLVIDPGLVFSTYSGSTADNWGFTATYDLQGNVYSGGIVCGFGYPVSVGAYQFDFGGGDPGGSFDYSPGWDIGIIKYDSTGQNRLYATYLGGNSSEMPHSLIVNQSNELVILGTTGSSDFPVSATAYDKTFNGGDSIVYDNVVSFFHGIDIFVSKLSPDGSNLVASTFIGGAANDGLNYRQHYVINQMHGNDSLYYNYADGARGEIITDDKNNVYIGTCTFSKDFPVSSNAFQKNFSGREEGVVFKLDNNLTSLVWSSYIGGSEDDAVYSIDTDNMYNLFVTGGTSSSDFPVTSGSIQTIYNGGTTDGFLTHISQDGSKILKSTYYGSSEYDQSYFVRTDKENHVYIYGQTKAPGNTMIRNAKYNKPNSGQFITKMNTTLDTIIWSTAFGTGNGKPNISPTAFSVDICNRVYISGWGREWPNHDGNTWNNIEGTKNMDVTTDAVQKITDGQDFYIMVMKNDASALQYATYFGELSYFGCQYSGHDHVDGGTSRFDKKGNIYQSTCASCGACDHFPTTIGAWSNHNMSWNCNNAVFKINISFDLTLADFDIPPVKCAPANISFKNTGLGKKFIWNFGDNSPLSYLKDPVHTFKKAGSYSIQLIALDSQSCNIADTIVKQLQLLKDTTYLLPDKSICFGEKIQIGVSPNPDPNVTYHWFPTTGISDPTVPNPYASPANSTTYMLLETNQSCTDTIIAKVNVFKLPSLTAGNDTAVCKGSGLTLQATPFDNTLVYIWSSTAYFIDTLNKNIHDNKLNLINLLSPKTFYVKVSNDKCIFIDSVHVDISEIKVQIEEIRNVSCYGLNDGQISISVTGGINPYFFVWNNGKTSSTITGLKPGKYIVTVTDKIKCFADTTVPITEPLPLLDSLNYKINTCLQACNGIVSAYVSGGMAPYKYLWSNGQSGAAIENLCKGKYSVTITDKNNCMRIDKIELKDTLMQYYKLTTTADSAVIWEGSTTIVRTTYYPQANYHWSPESVMKTPDNYFSEVTPLKTTVFRVTMTDGFGCEWYDSVKVEVKEIICGEPYIFVPNAFTPNGDGKNDLLTVKGRFIKNLFFAVYDRWGEKMFETKNQSEGWDGVYKGELCDPAVYVYYLDAECINKEKYFKKGNITLIR